MGTTAYPLVATASVIVMESQDTYNVSTMEVGIRELKSHLSRYLASVRRGEVIVVTDRGVPVARLEPVRPAEAPAALKRLVDAGRAIDKGPPDHLPEPIKFAFGEKTFSDFVREQRR